MQNEIESYGGPVWDMKVSYDRCTLAVACDDGTARLFDLSDPKTISYARCTRKQQGMKQSA